jgi:hypothetical protein
MYCIIHRRLLDTLPHHAGSGGEAYVLPGIGRGSVWRCRPLGSVELLPHCERLVEGQIIVIRMCVICLSVYRYSNLFLCCDCFCMYAFVAAKLIQKKFPSFCGSRTFRSIHILHTLHFLEPLVMQSLQHAIFDTCSLLLFRFSFCSYCLLVWLRSFPIIHLDLSRYTYLLVMMLLICRFLKLPAA